MEDQNQKQSVNPNKGKGRGFASMHPKRQKEVASLGGKAAHAKGTAHTWTSEEAREAGRKGCKVRQGKKVE